MFPSKEGWECGEDRRVLSVSVLESVHQRVCIKRVSEWSPESGKRWYMSVLPAFVIVVDRQTAVVSGRGVLMCVCVCVLYTSHTARGSVLAIDYASLFYQGGVGVGMGWLKVRQGGRGPSPGCVCALQGRGMAWVLTQCSGVCGVPAACCLADSAAWGAAWPCPICPEAVVYFIWSLMACVAEHMNQVTWCKHIHTVVC